MPQPIRRPSHIFSRLYDYIRNFVIVLPLIKHSRVYGLIKGRFKSEERSIPTLVMTHLVAGPRIELGSRAYETRKLPLLHPAIISVGLPPTANQTLR